MNARGRALWYSADMSEKPAKAKPSVAQILFAYIAIGTGLMAFFQAGMLYQDAAKAIREEEAEDQTSVEVERIRAMSFDHLRAGLEAIESIDEPVLDRHQLESAFWSAAQRDSSLALLCLDRLRKHEDVPREARLPLLMQGVKLALRRDEPDDVELARSYAKTAHEHFPDSAAAVSWGRASSWRATRRQALASFLVTPSRRMA